MPNICPVCGYPNLQEPAYDTSGLGSFEICPSCSYQFEVTDADEGISHEQWRNKWIKDGMPWFSRNGKPANWDPVEQLKNIRNRFFFMQ